MSRTRATLGLGLRDDPPLEHGALVGSLEPGIDRHAHRLRDVVVPLPHEPVTASFSSRTPPTGIGRLASVSSSFARVGSVAPDLKRSVARVSASATRRRIAGLVLRDEPERFPDQGMGRAYPLLERVVAVRLREEREPVAEPEVRVAEPGQRLERRPAGLGAVLSRPSSRSRTSRTRAFRMRTWNSGRNFLRTKSRSAGSVAGWSGPA